MSKKLDVDMQALKLASKAFSISSDDKSRWALWLWLREKYLMPTLDIVAGEFLN